MEQEQPQASINYSEIGELLKRAREQQRLPIDQASRLLHIRVRYLEAMEQGSLDELPGLPYVRGYIQAYAAFLGLDKEEIIRRFDAIANAKSVNLYFPQVLSKEKTPTPPLVWGGLVLAAVAYLLWYAFATPSNKRVSMVDVFPAPPSPLTQLSAEIIKDVACLKPQEGLYPPCILIKEPEYRVSPLDKDLNSVMELEVLPLDIPKEAPKKTEKVIEPDEEQQTDEEYDEE